KKFPCTRTLVHMSTTRQPWSNLFRIINDTQLNEGDGRESRASGSSRSHIGHLISAYRASCVTACMSSSS
ncbi:hypothetical protein JI435_303620, partial [Parastagonospora nodorum SN15]